MLLKIALTATIVLSLLQLHAQVKAVTEYGDTIYVYDNGTWTYELEYDAPDLPSATDNVTNADAPIDTVDVNYTYPSSSSKSANNRAGMYRLHYNPEHWKRVPPASFNEDAEFVLQHRQNDAFALVIWEETPIDPEVLYRIALENMATVGEVDDVTVKKVEHLKVNGSPVIRATYTAKIQTIPVTFVAQYYSDDRGCMQFLVWTSDTIWKSRTEQLNNLAAGLAVIKE